MTIGGARRVNERITATVHLFMAASISDDSASQSSGQRDQGWTFPRVPDGGRVPSEAPMMRSRIPVGMALALVAAATIVLPATASADGRGGGRGGASVGASGGRSGGFVGRPGFNNGFNNNGFNNRGSTTTASTTVASTRTRLSSWARARSGTRRRFTPRRRSSTRPRRCTSRPSSSTRRRRRRPTTRPRHRLRPGPRVVEFPTGRYELRGDGVATPHSWVWVPNPPSAPPGPPPVPAAPEAPPVDPSSRPSAPAPNRTIYRWTDDNGVTVLTDNLNNVPERYRIQLVNRTKL